MTYRLHPAAEAEHLEQIAFYEAGQTGLGKRYHERFLEVMGRVWFRPPADACRGLARKHLHALQAYAIGASSPRLQRGDPDRDVRQVQGDPPAQGPPLSAMRTRWDAADGELAGSTLDVSGLIRIAAASTFGRLHILLLIPELLSRNPGLRVDLVVSDSVRDMVEDRIDLAIRVGLVNEPDAVVKRVAGTPLVCVGSRRDFEQKVDTQDPRRAR